MSGIAGISDGNTGPTTGTTARPGLADIKWGAKGPGSRLEAPPKRPDGVPPTFVVFKTESCPFCHQTMDFLKALHDQRGDFQVAAVDATDQRDEFRKVSGYTRRTTVPQIFLDGRFVGGWDDLARAAKKGHLDSYLDGKEWGVSNPEAEATQAPKWAFWRKRQSPANSSIVQE